MRVADGFVRFLVLIMLLIGVGGCNSADEYATVPVSGVVTCQGKPVANATVNFTPLAEEGRSEGRPGRLALGNTDPEGRFRLTTYENYDGAIIGRHRVTVGLIVDEETGPPKERFPCAGSSKEVTVERGMDEIKIDF